jgi:hypothetical protein
VLAWHREAQPVAHGSVATGRGRSSARKTALHEKPCGFSVGEVNPALLAAALPTARKRRVRRKPGRSAPGGRTLGRFPSTDGLSPLATGRSSPSASLLGGESSHPTRRRASGIPLIRANEGVLAALGAGYGGRGPGRGSADGAAASPPVCRVTNHPTSGPSSQLAALSASGHPLIIRPVPRCARRVVRSGSARGQGRPSR